MGQDILPYPIAIIMPTTLGLGRVLLPFVRFMSVVQYLSSILSPPKKQALFFFPVSSHIIFKESQIFTPTIKEKASKSNPLSSSLSQSN